MFILFVLLAACAPKQESVCGDGICDENEQKNPELCPKDCFTSGVKKSGEGEAEQGSNWFGSVTWSCYMDRAGHGFDRWVAEMEIEIRVDAENNITGSGFGEFVSSGCEVTGCDCSWNMGPISATITGKKEGDIFHIKVSPMAKMIQTVVCPKSKSSVDMNGQFFACQPAENGLSDFRIEARDGAVHTFRGARAPDFTADGRVVIHFSRN